jgi:hypothetical protein
MSGMSSARLCWPQPADARRSAGAPQSSGNSGLSSRLGFGGPQGPGAELGPISGDQDRQRESHNFQYWSDPRLVHPLPSPILSRHRKDPNLVSLETHGSYGNCEGD